MIDELLPHSAAPPEGVEDLFRRHSPALVRLAYLLGADDPSDLAQEAFVRLHTRPGGLRDDAAALAYLRRTVVNLHRSRLRHLKVARRLRQRARYVPSAETSALEYFDRQYVLVALDQLSHRHRVVLVLRYWLDLSGPEMARTLDLPIGTVKSRTSRALNALAELMEKQS